MRARVAIAMVAAILAASACAPTLPKSDLRSGLSQEIVRAKIEKEPERVVAFELPEQPALKFTVLEYFLAPQENWPEQPFWVLFNEDGLVSFGPGGLREAKARAYDSYFEWMAAQGDMLRGQAERKLREKMAELYGVELNPAIDDYLAYRAEVESEVDAKKLDDAGADRLIYAKYVELDARNRTVEAPLLPPAEAKRFAVMAQMGLDEKSARLAQRPRAATVGWSMACESMASRLGTPDRCR
jgi:hypothetical protein